MDRTLGSPELQLPNTASMQVPTRSKADSVCQRPTQNTEQAQLTAKANFTSLVQLAASAVVWE